MNNDMRAINELKMLSIDMINQAKSGYPGICLDMAPVMFTLFAKVLRCFPNNPNFFNRDRVILSSAHITPLYYAMLHMAGFPVSKEDLMNYRRYNSITPGLPEVNTTPGVDASCSYAGDGVGIAVGTILAKRFLNHLVKQEEEKLNLLTYTTYCFISDADILSGSSFEAMSMAVSQKLDHLVFLYDYNKMGEDGDQSELLPQNIMKQYQTMGFYVDFLKDLTNIRELTKAIEKASKCGKPALLIFETKIGQDSFNAGTPMLHSGPLSIDDTENMRKKFNTFLAPFEVSKDSMIHVQTSIKERISDFEGKWNEVYNKAKGRMSSTINQVLSLLETNTVEIPFDSSNYKINEGYRETLLESNDKVMDLFASRTPMFLGGSAGLALSTRALISGNDYQTWKTPLVRNIRFGTRERAMANILNGISLSGLRVFGSTKLCYFDECSSGVRMSALMNLPVTYIFTHDSIYDSVDGPARIPCEQLTTLRSIPNLTVFRPADIMEVMGSWEQILKNGKPAALVLSKNTIPKLPGSNSKEVEKGAYIIHHEEQRLDGILIATGSEVVSAIQIAYDLKKNGLDLRVVSMPSMELFKAMGEEYRMQLLPPDVKTMVLEAGAKACWYEYASNDDAILGINDFAYSGVTIEVLQKMNYDYDSLKLQVDSFFQ